MADYFKQSNTNRPRIGVRKQGVEVPHFDFSKEGASGNNLEEIMAKYTTTAAFKKEHLGGKSKRIFKTNVKNKKKNKKKLN